MTGKLFLHPIRLRRTFWNTEELGSPEVTYTLFLCSPLVRKRGDGMRISSREVKKSERMKELDKTLVVSLQSYIEPK